MDIDKKLGTLSGYLIDDNNSSKVERPLLRLQISSSN